MAKVKVKICGITNMEDALAAVKAGCDGLGFVFYEKSPRFITPAEAAMICGRLPPRIEKIGVFVNAREKTVRRVAGLCGLTMLQFHGKESPDYCGRFRGRRVIKAFRIENEADVRGSGRYRVFARLFDAFVREIPGGTGRSFDWSLAAGQKPDKSVLFLSGGLTPANVGRAIHWVRPQWVDVSSSIERFPGKKDHQKMLEFIWVAKKACL